MNLFVNFLFSPFVCFKLLEHWSLFNSSHLPGYKLPYFLEMSYVGGKSRVCGKPLPDGGTCNYSATNMNTMAFHKRAKHGPKIECVVCQQLFSLDAYLRHKHCTICGKGYSTELEYNKHFQKHATPGKGNYLSFTKNYQPFPALVYPQVLEQLLDGDHSILVEGEASAKEIEKHFNNERKDHSKQYFYAYSILAPHVKEILSFDGFVLLMKYVGRGQTERIDQHNPSNAKEKVKFF